MNLGHILFSFIGRINRAKWWLSVLVSVIISLVITGLILVVKSDAASLILNIVSWVLSLWIGLAAGAKRLHDLNRSGAWLVLFFGAPILLILILIGYAAVTVGTAFLSAGDSLSDEMVAKMIIELFSQVGGMSLIVLALLFALWLWGLIWFGCLRGTVGPNQYGPDPLEGRI